jgi:hypothetical protein
VNALNARTLIPPVIPPHPSSPDDHWLAAFPLRTFLELGAYPEAAGSARGHARNVLAEWRLDHLSEAVCLVASELIANAMEATRQARWEAGLPPLRLWLLGGPGAGGSGAGRCGAGEGRAGADSLGRGDAGRASASRANGGDAGGVACGGADVSRCGRGGSGEVLLLVWDAVAEIPAAPGVPDELAESGRGLWIVAAYSTRWDFYWPRWEHGGKVARALISRPSID